MQGISSSNYTPVAAPAQRQAAETGESRQLQAQPAEQNSAQQTRATEEARQDSTQESRATAAVEQAPASVDINQRTDELSQRLRTETADTRTASDNQSTQQTEASPASVRQDTDNQTNRQQQRLESQLITESSVTDPNPNQIDAII